MKKIKTTFIANYFFTSAHLIKSKGFQQIRQEKKNNCCKN